MWSLKVIWLNCSLYSAHKVLYAEYQSWPRPLAPWSKINRVPLLIIHNSHVKFQSDWAKTVVCIVSTGSYTQSAKVDLDLWPRDPKSIGFLLIMVNVHVKFESDCAKTVVAIVSTRSYTQSAKIDLDLWPRDPKWPWPLAPWSKINRVPLLIIQNSHVKFQSDWAKTVVCIVSTGSYTQSAKVDLDLWPRDPKSIGFLLSSWWMCTLSLKVIGQKL